NADILPDGSLADTRGECRTCQAILAEAKFEDASAAVNYMRDQIRMHMVAEGAKLRRLAVVETAEPRALLAYLENRVLPDRPGLLPYLRAAAILTGQRPLPKAGDTHA